ncbi:MAG: hypothetical protein K2Y21_02110 [Phycisphaerales bacterium]|nr:hypothetical protein [Phycisphaerales bacterium]
MHTRTWVVIVAAAASSIARADFIVKDSLQKDQGWTAWDSKVGFTEKGMTAFGVVTRDYKEFPSEFDAMVTIDASKSIIWSFGVAGSYSPETGYTGIGITANSNKEVGFVFARWEKDSIVDMMQIDPDAAAWLDGIHSIEIGVREDVTFAAIDGKIVAKLGYNPKFSGTQVVIASFAEGDTFFRDLTVASRIPAPGAWMIAASAVFIAARRRR